MPKALQTAGNTEKYLFFGIFRDDSKLKNLCPKKLKLGLPHNTICFRAKPIYKTRGKANSKKTLQGVSLQGLFLRWKTLRTADFLIKTVSFIVCHRLSWLISVQLRYCLGWFGRHLHPSRLKAAFQGIADRRDIGPGGTIKGDDAPLQNLPGKITG